MDNETKILKAIMERYEGLVPLRIALSECTDTVLVNLLDVLACNISEEEILSYISKMLSRADH